MKKTKQKEETKSNKRYGLYVRVSTEEQARSKEGSITSQIQRLEEYLRAKNHVTPQYTLYKEEGKSAKDTNRLEYQKLLQDIKERKIDIVMCTELSRFSRSVSDFLKFIEFANEYNVQFISIKESDFDTTRPHGKLMTIICMALAQFERELTSERTSTNMQARQRRGLFNGGYFYGYRPRPNQKGYLDVDPHEARVVNLIFEKYLEWSSADKIAVWLNAEGYRTREFTSRHDKFHQAQTWNKKCILQTLQNPKYIGKIEDKNELLDAVWEAIIPEETWKKVQALLQQNRRMKRNSNKPNKQHTYLLTNLVYCAHCGLKLENGSGTSHKGPLYFYYRHPQGKRKPDCPYPASLRALKFEKLVCTEIIRLLEDDELIDLITDQASEKLNQDIAELRSRMDEIGKQMLELKAESDGLVKKMLVLEEKVIQEFVSPRLGEISAQKLSLEAKKIELQQQIQELESENISPEDLRYQIGSITKGFEELNERQQQKLMGMLVSKVELKEGKVEVFLRSGNSPATDVPTEKPTDKKKSPQTDEVRGESSLAPRDGLEPPT